MTLGLPVYNAQDFLVPCLDSLMNQTYRNMELIISDNASTDGTAVICADYAARDARIRLVMAESNQGAAWNHRRVLQLARGQYFKWCGADDIIDPRFLECCVAALEPRSDAVLAFPLSFVINEEGQQIQQTTDRLPVSSADVRERFQALMSPWHPTHNPFYGVIRREALERSRPFGSFLAGDRSLLAELTLAGPFLQVEEFLMYRRHYAKHLGRTVAIEQEMLNPAGAEKYCPRELTMLREHTISVLRARQPWRTKARLLGALGRWVLGQRKTLVWESHEYILDTLRRFRRAAAR